MPVGALALQGKGGDRHSPQDRSLVYNAVRYGTDYVDPGARSTRRVPFASGSNLQRRAKAFGFVLQPLEPKAGAAVSIGVVDVRSCWRIPQHVAEVGRRSWRRRKSFSSAISPSFA